MAGRARGRRRAARERGTAAEARSAGAPESQRGDEIAAVFILLLSAASLRGWVAETNAAHSALRVLWWITYLGAAARLTHRFGAEWLRWTLRRQPILCLLLAVALASGLWSLAPAFSLQKAVSLVGTTVLGLFIAWSCPPQRLLRVLFWTFLLLVVSSLLVSVLLTQPAGEGLPVGWRGILVQRNSLGGAAVLAATFFLLVTLKRYLRPLWGALLFLSSLVLVAGSRSRTSLAALGVAVAAATYVAIALPIRRPSPATWRWAWAALVLAVAVVPFFVGPLAAALGNDDPLNGRTKLWEGSRTILGERPLTGYGYAAVWGRADATLLPHVAITAHRSASNAHNAIVNIATELGLPAALAACVYLFAALVEATRLVEHAPSAFYSFALVFLIDMAVLCFTEAHLLQVHSFFWILMVALTTAVRRTEA